MDLLEQIPALVGIPLVRARQPLERAAVCLCRLGIQLLRAVNRTSYSREIVAGYADFLQRLTADWSSHVCG